MSNSAIVYQGYSLTLTIPFDVLGVLRNCRQVHNEAPERFGVIIGSRTAKSKEYWIEAVTKPMENDKATRSSFLLQDKNHQDTVDSTFQSSGGTSIYLGTWHTHPEPLPVPSLIDKKDWKACMQRNPGRQLFFIIVGTEELRIYIHKNWRFTFSQLKRKQ
jgi:integrative and conjugative element protein (TIGR02256 family)